MRACKKRITGKHHVDPLVFAVISSSSCLIFPHWEGTFPLIANVNAQACCESFYPITMLDNLSLQFILDTSTRSELASWFFDEWKGALSAEHADLRYIFMVIIP